MNFYMELYVRPKNDFIEHFHIIFQLLKGQKVSFPDSICFSGILCSVKVCRLYSRNLRLSQVKMCGENQLLKQRNVFDDIDQSQVQNLTFSSSSTQDGLENFFSCLRTMGGSNLHLDLTASRFRRILCFHLIYSQAKHILHLLHVSFMLSEGARKYVAGYCAKR